MGNKMYEKLLYIKKHNLLNFTTRFLSVNLFHILMECLITIYLMELAGVFTKFMILSPDEIPLIVIFVFLPAIAVVVLSILFGIFCINIFINKVYEYSRQVAFDHSDRFQIFNTITQKCQKDIISMHRTGIYLYTVSSALGPWFLTYFYPNHFISPNGFIIYVFFIGLVMGIAWNTSGIYRNQRINWCYLLAKLQTKRISKINRKRNYILYIKNAICSIISLTLIISIMIMITFNLNSEIDLSDIISEYNFVILVFITLLSFYVKTTTQKIYANDDALDVFPSIKVILGITD